MAKASLVVIGGGILGCSIAYHLAKRGVDDVLLLERRDLATASSSQAAGLMFKISSKPAVDHLSRRTFELFSELEEITGEALDFKAVGSLRVAESEANKASLLKTLNRAREEGTSAEMVDRNWRSEKLPWFTAGDDALTVYFKEEGYIDPYRLTRAYAKAARLSGATVKAGIAVLGIRMANGVVTGVETDQGVVPCDRVVVAGGSWSNNLTLPLGIALPMVPTRSHFWIAAPEPDFGDHQPMMIHADAGAYTRPEVGGLLLGVQEARSRTFDYRILPEDISSFAVTDEGDEWDALIEAEQRVSGFFPGLGAARFEHYMAGLSAYTPDGHFLLGAAKAVEGLFVAAGCCGSGVMASGGIGDALAELITEGKSGYDLMPFDLQRFGAVEPASEAFQLLCANARARKAK
ncbi:FAD-binding oxidoreductase [Kiloniella laminariae]|uniref:FAD-binding oxidoreductase n=1 Tax=Kiloniella laminariae TaxID=454162 RepID=A0ABT4LKB6_9PROT|nr:FAD-binding oxidoreductase [Kiloniella laminariae]MCZ4281557.1 FAD-binding oxidoreductase [Kiloniella laminariae]